MRRAIRHVTICSSFLLLRFTTFVMPENDSRARVSAEVKMPLMSARLPRRHQRRVNMITVFAAGDCAQER